MICKNCSTNNDKDSAFCSNCGAVLIASSEIKDKIITVGRSETNDIVIANQNVSSNHARFIFKGEDIYLEDLNSSNGTFVNNVKITKAKVSKDDKIKFSQSYSFDWNTISTKFPSANDNIPLQENNKSFQTDLKNKSSIRIGRAKDNDIVIENIKVSRKHARLEKAGNEWFIEDLESSNGTYLNGKRIKREKVTAADVITIGGIPLNLQNLFDAKFEIKGDISLSSKNLSFRAGNKLIVDDISLTILPGEFVGLIGPSGAGKTSFMMMLNGVVKPSAGDVYINSQSLFQNFNQFKGQIGYVPQDDIIHPELKVAESLNFTAKLRLENYSDSELGTQVDNVMTTLGLEETRNTLIGSALKKGISGGQRKRVNLGQELLTEPSILFLDEPTSGLDPKTDLDVMMLLKKISEKGKIVILTTHNITADNFNILTHLIVLTKGGKLAYFGKADQASKYFEVEKPFEIFSALEKKEADYWKEKYLNSPLCHQFIRQRENLRVSVQDVKQEKTLERKANFSQFLTLTKRYFKIKLRDKLSTLILLLQAPIIAALIAMVFNKPEEKTQALFVLVIASIWLGCSNAAREIVAEQSIYKRERMVNLKIPSYLFSKVCVLLLLCIIQCAILAFVSVPLIELNSNAFSLFILLLITSVPALLTGLLVSSLVSSSEAAMGLIPLVLIPQVILGGLISKFLNMSTFVKLLAGLMTSRWSFEAAMIGEFGGEEEIMIQTIGFSPDNLAIDILVILGYSVLFFLLTALVLKRKDI
ncbi:MAG: FHA domain-containing protein [Ignavibacteriaceae bacterium]|nr:FHA domain-containing protein [Ignavibacteriaceae bacterium]